MNFLKEKRFFKGCHPQILLGPFFNTLSHKIYSRALSFPYHHMAVENASVCIFFSYEIHKSQKKTQGKKMSFLFGSHLLNYN